MQTNHQTKYRTIVKAPIDKVWEALTDPSVVKKYFFGSNLETDWKVGSPLYFKGEYEGKTYQDKGIVQEFIPYESLSFSYLSNWSGLPDSSENYLLVSYKVSEVSGGTELIVTQSNYDEDKAAHSEENWKTVIDGLKSIVE